MQQPSVAAPAESLPAYNRDDWAHWEDADGDCQNTRHEVLIAESRSSVTLTADGCRVLLGEWVAPFTGQTVSDAATLDVDHMVPLQNAHISGGWAWSTSTKRDYANDLEDPQHLIAVMASANRSKGSRSPADWQPPLESYWCRYAVDWIGIKNRWDLTVTSAEWSALASMLGTCAGGSPRVLAAPATAATPTPTATPTATAGACGGATAMIGSVDKAAKPEVVTITGNGDLTGFYLLSVRGNQRYDFPAGFNLDGSVEILSYTDQFTDTATELWWTKSAIWNNSSEDDGELRDCTGQRVSFWDD